MSGNRGKEGVIEAVSAAGGGTGSGSDSILTRLGVEIPPARAWQRALAGAVVVLIGYAVFSQLFRDGGLAQPGEGAEASWPMLGPAIAALVLAAIIDIRLTLRALLTIPVIALVGLAILTFVSRSWSIVEPEEAIRLGMAIAAYVLMAIAAAVASTRLSALPFAVLLVAVAVVAGAMGLWGFANLKDPLAVFNQGQLTPAGPFRYRNTLALLAVASLIPLLRWSVWDSLKPDRVLISIVAGLSLGVSATVVATSGSDFAVLMTLVLIAIAVLFPGPTLGTSRQQALGINVAVLVIGVLAWFMFRKALGQMPGEESTRTLVMVGLVLAMPLVAWAAGFGASKISDRITTRLVQAAAIVAVLGGVLFLLVGTSSPGGLTQSRSIYYEVTIETAKEEPMKGFGAGSYARASIDSQLRSLSTTIRFAHSIPGEMWVELGIGGLVLSLLLYLGSLVLSWRTRLLPGGALLIPLVVGFLVSGLIDWSWHMTAVTALWASGLGALTGVRMIGRSAADGTAGEADPPPDEISGSSA